MLFKIGKTIAKITLFAAATDLIGRGIESVCQENRERAKDEDYLVKQLERAEADKLYKSDMYHAIKGAIIGIRERQGYLYDGSKWPSWDRVDNALDREHLRDIASRVLHVYKDLHLTEELPEEDPYGQGFLDGVAEISNLKRCAEGIKSIQEEDMSKQAIWEQLSVASDVFEDVTGEPLLSVYTDRDNVDSWSEQELHRSCDSYYHILSHAINNKKIECGRSLYKF